MSTVVLLNLKLLHAVKYWTNHDNRRKFFVEFASQKGFDPLVPENWKNVKYKELFKKGKALRYYNGSMSKALADVFPDLGVLFFVFPIFSYNIFFKEPARKKPASSMNK